MKVTGRLLGAIWLCALLVIGIFGCFQIRAERKRLLEDLERRAALLGERLKESVGPAARRGAPAMARVLKKFGRADRRIAVYDAFGSVVVTIWPFYRHADFCLVSSLHDGMNLVAKEFVSVRDDDDGVLILSRFTGAARELRDALLVNPYDFDETADAIRTALEMLPEERTLRMSRMRRQVNEHNIYRWAGLLLGELARVREAVTAARV